MDFAKAVFDPVKHFVRVLWQQGRVTLDADAADSSGGKNRPLRPVPAETQAGSGSAEIRKPDSP